MKIYIAIVYAEGGPGVPHPLTESDDDSAIASIRELLNATANGTGYDLWHGGKRLASFRGPPLRISPNSQHRSPGR